MTKRSNRASQKNSKILGEASDQYNDDDADIDIYGGSDEGEVEDDESDVDSVDLDDEDDTVDLDDVDDADISDDDEALDGASIDTDDDEVGDEDVKTMLQSILDILQGQADGEDSGEEEIDLDGEDEELSSEPGEDDFDDEDIDDEDDEDDEDEDLPVKEEADPSSWNGKMQKLKTPSGQDSKQKEMIKDPTVAKSSNKAKALPKGKKPSGQEGNTDYGKDVLGSSDKANKAVGQASAPKAQAILDVVKKMLTTNSNTIQALYKGDTKLKAMEAIDFSVSPEELSALAESEGLSKEGRQIAQKIVESNVRKRVAEALDVIDARYALALSEEVDASEAALIDKIDEYMDYTVENYFSENKVAIEEGVSRELDDSFVEGLRDLFEAHYVDVPKGKENLVEKLERQLKEKDEKLKQTTKRAVAYRKEARDLKRERLISEASADLSLNEHEQLKSLCEDVEFDGNVDVFKKKIKRLKEANFGKRKVTQPEQEFEALAEQIDRRGSSSIDQYVKTINRTTQR